jgi:outer membrane lipoprotein carrier protein
MSNSSKNVTRAVVLVCLAFSLMSPHLRADRAGSNIREIIEKMQSFYAASSDYQASFVQTTTHKMFPGRLQRAYGTVKFRKGGLMRWEYRKPEQKLFIYDGAKLWIYEPEVPQVISGTADAEKLRRALAFLSGEGRIQDEYGIRALDARKYGYEKGLVLGLTPKDGKSPYKRIELYLDKSTYRVVRSVVVDQENNRNRLDFSNPKLNSNLQAKEFQFTPPPGVPVLSPDQQE